MTDISSIKSTTPQPNLHKIAGRQPVKSDAPQSESPPGTADGGESSAARISRLFHRAGIVTSKFSKLDEDINKKLLRRKQVKQSIKLANLENILEKALEFSAEQSSDEQMDLDWFYSFLDLAENIFSEAMQEIWGKIFAVEISKPGTFSLRTLQTLKQLTQRDANIFQSAVSLSSRMRSEQSPKIICGFYQKPNLLSFLGFTKAQQLNLAEFGLSYPDLLTLMDAGLIFNSEIESGELAMGKRSEWRFSNETFHLSPQRSGILLKYYKFTSTGAELSKLVNAPYHPTYLDALKMTLQGGFDID